MKSKQIHSTRSASGVRRNIALPPIVRPPRVAEQLKSILQATTDLYGVWNVASGPICISDASLTALGYSAGSSGSRRLRLQRLIHPDDRATFAAWLENCLAGDAPNLKSEFRVRTKAGLYFWFEIRGKTIRTDKLGTPTKVAYSAHEIHAEKEQRQALMASRERLDAIAQASQDCIAVIDPVELRLIAFNEPLAELIFAELGVRLKAGMSFTDIDPQDADKWLSFCRQVLVEGKISQDRLFPRLNVIHQIVGECLVRDGLVYGIGLSSHEITAQKQIERALRKSEEKFSKAFREAPFPLSLTGAQDHRYIEINDAFCEVTEYSRDELIGKTPFDIDIWVPPERRIELVNQAMATGDVRNFELVFRTKSGDLRDALGSASLIELDGELCLLSVTSDVTDRKRALQALQESEERLRIAIESGNMSTFEWDVVTDVIQRKEQSIRMLDLQNSGGLHTKQELIDRVHPDDRANFVRVLRSLSPDKPAYKTVYRLPHRDGQIVWVEESGTGIFEPDGKLRKVIGIVCDVTESREGEHALRELSQRLITSQEEERRRVARELHDQIGQEAALICTQAQRIDSGVADQEHTTHSDVHELYGRIKNLAVGISKLSHRLHSSELSFLGLAVAAERLCHDFASQYGIDVEYQAKPLPPTLDTAKSLCFYRVLQESLQNVAKHSHATQVVIELQTIKNELVLIVKDNGTGFDVNKTGSESGLGLLSMRERLNLIGGHFSIASKPGRGTNVMANVFV